MTVNHGVAGSSPARGAEEKSITICDAFFVLFSSHIDRKVVKRLIPDWASNQLALSANNQVLPFCTAIHFFLTFKIHEKTMAPLLVILDYLSGSEFC
jgi:hypothetical protein